MMLEDILDFTKKDNFELPKNLLFLKEENKKMAEWCEFIASSLTALISNCVILI